MFAVKLDAPLTLATLASVAASVTIVDCMTLCTARLNIGSTLLFCPPPKPDAVLADELSSEPLDFTDELLFKFAAPEDGGIGGESDSVTTASSEDGATSTVGDFGSIDGRSRFWGEGDKVVMSVDMEALRVEVDR